MNRVRYKISKIQTRKPAIPEPQTVLVSGFFDTIEHSRKCFQLTMKTGEIIKGRIDEGTIDMEQMRKFWGQPVTIKGVLHFKAAGKPRFLEAQAITAWQEGDELFNSISVPQSALQILAQVKTEISGRNVEAEIWGKWPGEESIEQLLETLKASETANSWRDTF
jgi:hypothetical protein